MNDLVERSFSLNLTALRFLGLYPRRNPSKCYLIYGYILLFCSLVPDPLFGILYFLLDENLTLLDAGLNLLVMMGMLSYIPKMLPLIFNNKQIRECIYYLQFFNSTLSYKQKDIYNDSIWVCQRNSRLFLVSIVFDITIWVSRPLFSPQQQRQFLLDVWLPFDPSKSDILFYFIYVFIAMGASYTGLTNASVDTLICGLVYHAGGQLKILKDNLEFLVDYTEDRYSEEVKHRVIYQKIRECTQQHHQIICFVKKIESAFSWVVFSQFFGSTVMICLCCLQLSLMKPGSSNFLLVAAYLATLLVQLYFYCHYGSTLYEESNTLATAAYLGRWYEYDIKSQKALLLFMERAKIPMPVTAGKVLDLSLDTFTNVLKKSYSLLAMLENY